VAGKVALAAAALLVAACSLQPLQPEQKFSDHAKKLQQYAALSQTLYGGSLERGQVFQVRYEGLLVEGRTRYALVTDDAARTHSIAIQGTGSVADLGTGLDFLPTYDRALDMELHSGFRATALAVRGDVLPKLKEGYSIGVAGHSAGGAAAQILALYLATVDKKAVTEVYTFGQPKFGAPKGERASLLAGRTVRVVNCDDAIPMLPNPAATGALVAAYRGIGPVVFLAQDGRVWFSRTDVELDNLQLLGRSFVREMVVGKPFRAHLMESYVERLAKAAEDPAATDYGKDAKYICS
jgi:hypothetical protein